MSRPVATGADRAVAAGIPVRVTRVTKRYDDTVAVDDVSLDIHPAEIVAVVGPSGCGKSTLLRLVAGLVTTDAGTIELAGELVDDGVRSLPPERRRVGLVFQDHQLFPHLTVAGNVRFGLGRRSGVSRPEADDRVREVLELVGLGPYAERYPHELSGGERQRVALARALAPRPALMLLDEPFASLDPNLRAQIRTEVVAILRRTGTAAVMVTHDQTEALAVGDRVALMRAGRLVQVGSPSDLFHEPVDRFVGAFMGEASFLPVRAVAGGLRCLLGAVPSRDDLHSHLVAGGPTDVAAMVRPDDVELTPQDGDRSADDGRVTGTVVSGEFRGTVWAYDVRLDDGTTLRALRSHLEPLAVGTRVQASLHAGHRPVLVADPHA